jgi:hypothetical protein
MNGKNNEQIGTIGVKYFGLKSEIKKYIGLDKCALKFLTILF